ncbi:MAG: peptide-methionine (S)-S-oxide reductase MsrA [Patescibacteria group bacterium]
METVVLGGGCFWCTEAIFQQLRGVVKVTSGYAGGEFKNPGYYDLAMGRADQAEVIKVEFDPAVITLRDLLDVFFHTHNPTTVNQQGADKGPAYRSVILYTSPEQKGIAENLIAELGRSGEFGNPIVTDVEPLGEFYEAEEEHQSYYERNSYLPYCEVVISPKLAKLREKYREKLK